MKLRNIVVGYLRGGGWCMLIGVVIFAAGFKLLEAPRPYPAPVVHAQDMPTTTAGWQNLMIEQARESYLKKTGPHWNVKTMPFIKVCGCRVGAWPEVFEQLDRDASAAAIAWVQKRGEDIKVLRVEKHWETEFLLGYYTEPIPILTVTVYYTEEEQ
jgi:hypothetical protein